jgi:spermidine synthase
LTPRLFLLVSGSCGLIYEIIWMKMLTLVIGNTVFSITTVLTAFMGGLALGSFPAGRFIDKIKDPLKTS